MELVISRGKAYLIFPEEAVLKGQFNLAQGKQRRSVALGWMEKEKIVRAIEVIKEKSSFRTNGGGLVFPKNDAMQFRPMGYVGFVHRILADEFSPVFKKQIINR